jgi:hypothetical protein
VREVVNAASPREFNYAATFLLWLGAGLAMTLAMSLLIYVLIRAIGWVIGGFAAT